MKTKIKRHSRAVISVILAISMLVSCMMVGLIATDAAKVTGDETVGDTTYYLLCSFNQQDPATWSSNGSYATSSDYSFSITPSSFGKTSWANNTNYYVGVSSSNTYTDMYGQNGTVTVTKGTGINSAEAQTHGTYHFMRFTPSVTGSETIYVNCTVNGTAVTYDISTTSSGGETTYKKYTVAGTINVCGTEWSATDTNNDMETSDGVTYTKVFNSITVEDEAKFYFKVVKDHNWDVAYPSSNYEYSFPGAGKYDVTVTFNDNTQEITCTAVTSETKHEVTFTSSPADGGTISLASGTEVGEVNSKTVTATPNDGYDFSSWTLGTGIVCADSSTNTISIKTNASGSSYTVQANFTKKPVYTVTAKSNDTALGTVSASPTAAYQGQTVTVTYAENTGDYDSTAGYQITDAQGTDIASSVGASINTTSKTITFTMPNKAVTVKVNFKEYSAQSKYYYNGYTTSGFKSGYYGKQMTEAKIGGSTYSYYQVSGRTDVDQLFTVSIGNLKYDNGKILYFQAPTDYGDGWATGDNAQFAMFLSSDEAVIQDFQQMSRCSSLDHNTNKKKGFQINIPDGARYAYIKCGDGVDRQTVRIDLNTKNNGGNNAVYLGTWNSTYSQYEVNYFHNEDYLGLIGDVYEDFNSTGIYTNEFSTTGFGTYNINRANSTTSTVPKPNQDMSSAGDYYILYLYSGNTYTINNVTKKLTKDTVIWLPELPGTTSNNAIVYAKDGSLRNNSGGKVYKKFADYATTQITNAGIGSVRKDDDYDYLKHEKDGTELTITTTIDAGDYRDNYYVKGFSVNGVTPELLTPNDDGVYTLKITLGEDKITFDGGEVDYINDKYVEITPIYYTKDSSNSVTFYVRGFDDTVKASWGDTIAAYPFYNGASNVECAFGGYPGQPLINYGGKLFIDVPLSVTKSDETECAIQGITMSNYYWDRIHGTTDSENNLLHIKAVKSHVQTYDYDDFSKIFTEVKEQNKSPETIVFDFKYRTAQNNEKSATLGSTYANGWDDMVNAQGALVDIFGNELSESDKAKSPIYVVSDGYWNNYSGAYSTEWHIYKNDGTFIGTINPSVRWVQSAARLNETTYPYSGNSDYLSIYHSISSFRDEYTALQDYKNTPVRITFEEEIRNENGLTPWDDFKSSHNSNDWDKAKRSDGLWMYSFNGTKINANTVIEYSDDDGETYNVDTYVTGTNTSTKGMKAYFTNSDFNGETSVETRSNNEDFFKFTAESAGEYIFVGWYNKEMDGSTAKYMRISTAVNGQSSMESGGTFVARFIKNPSDQLTLSHTILKDDNYKGDGTATIKVEVKDAENTVVKTYNGITTGESEFTIPNTYIKYNHGYTLTVTLNTVPKGDDTFAQFTTSVNTKFYNNATESTGTNPATSVFSFAVDDLFEYDSENDHYNQTTKVLRYYSQLNQIKYHYQITYSYTSYRDQKGTQYYKVVGDFTEDDIKNYLEKSNNVYDQDTKTSVTAYSMENDNKRDAFINKYGPYENNFLKKISWNTKKRNVESEDTDEHNGMFAEYHSSTRTYLIDVNAKEYGNNQVTLEIYLPYNHYTEAKDNYDPIATGDKYIFDDDTQTIKLTNLNQMMWYATNNVKNYSNPEKQPKFVTAPQVLYNNDSPLIFRYWSVKKLESDTNTNKVEYTRCFSNEFNLSLYQNTYIEPVYTAPTDAEKASGKYASAHDNAVASGMGATITFMENSRNQYNEGMCGTETISSRQLQGDRVFTDFLISFANPQDTQYATYAAGTYSAGIVVERVAKLDKNQKGDFVTLTEEEYKDKYRSEVTNDKLTDITAFIENTGTYSSGKAYRDNTEIYDTNPQGVIKYQKSEVDAKTLDNKNRMDFYYSMSVRNHSGDFVDNHNADYVYRAYSYIKDSSGKVVMLSGDPLYFTIYDMASIANAAEGKTYDKPKTS